MKPGVALAVLVVPEAAGVVHHGGCVRPVMMVVGLAVVQGLVEQSPGEAVPDGVVSLPGAAMEQGAAVSAVAAVRHDGLIRFVVEAVERLSMAAGKLHHLSGALHRVCGCQSVVGQWTVGNGRQVQLPGTRSAFLLLPAVVAEMGQVRSMVDSAGDGVHHAPVQR